MNKETSRETHQHATRDGAGMTDLSSWAARHNVTPAALAELRALLLGNDTTHNAARRHNDDISETAVQNAVRAEASKRGGRLFRNNVGAGHIAETGSFLRWGLCNDSAALNAHVKSGDLIGLIPVTITPEHVGQTIGQFWSVECKHGAWHYTGTDREVAQQRWLEMVVALGGRAQFSTGKLT